MGSLRLGRRGGGLGSLVLLILIAIVIFATSDEDGGDRSTPRPDRTGPSGHRAGPPQRAGKPPSSRHGRGRRRPPGSGARVTRVIDGDTVEVRIGGREDEVRYIGVDTPETVKPGAPVQCFGPKASAFNHRLVEGQRVRLVFDAERRDVYGRLLAYVYLRGEFVNAELVKRGFARTLTIAPNDAYAPLFARLERLAGRAGRGLWSACSP